MVKNMFLFSGQGSQYVGMQKNCAISIQAQKEFLKLQMKFLAMTLQKLPLTARQRNLIKP